MRLISKNSWESKVFNDDKEAMGDGGILLALSHQTESSR